MDIYIYKRRAKMKNRLGYEIKEYKLVDKDGEFTYKTGTKAEVASYAIENQLLMVSKEKA